MQIQDELNLEITEEGLLELKQKHQTLINKERPIVIEEIKEARSNGDLSENSDYEAAKKKQAEVESEIQRLERIIDTAKIIHHTNDHVVRLGSVVKIETSKHIPKHFKLVNSIEADLYSTPIKISIESPVGKAILGYKRNDSIFINIDEPYKIKILHVQN